MKNRLLLYLLVLSGTFGFCQVKFPNSPNAETFEIPTIDNFNADPLKNILPDMRETNDPLLIQQQNYKQIMDEVDYHENIRIRQERINRDQSRNFALPSFSFMSGTQAYYDAFAKLNTLDSETYSIADAVFLIENTFYDNTQDFQKLKDQIIQTTEMLKSKMDELDYETKSNTAKNLILFQYFSEEMKLGGISHKPFKYDFEDFTGANDYSKMFVSKLMNTGTGQCHSMPLLYLILAEQIGAEAYLSFSPNHSYIRFPDDDGNTLSLELTNGMFSTNSFILQSGYVKSEALQNRIYMQSLSKQELLSQMYADLAGGYLHKYGYDEFIGEVINKSLELYPNNINARMYKANYQANKFEYVANELGIDPFNPQELQNIGNYPNAVNLLNEANLQTKQIENLGYEAMPMDAYVAWLNSVHAEKNKQESKEIQQSIKSTQKPTKKKTQKIKHDNKQKEEVKQKIFH